MGRQLGSLIEYVSNVISIIITQLAQNFADRGMINLDTTAVMEMETKCAFQDGKEPTVKIWFARLGAIQYMENAIDQGNANVALVGEANFATNVPHTPVASTGIATDLRGNAFATPIGVEYYAIKI